MIAPNRLLTVLLIFIPLTALADEPRGLDHRDAVLEASEQFMNHLQEDRVLTAYETLAPILGVDAAPYERSAEEAHQFFGQVYQQIGEPLSWAQVLEEYIDDHFLRLTFLQKFESAAFAWEMTFYRPDTHWRLVGISYTTDLDRLYRTR